MVNHSFAPSYFCINIDIAQKKIAFMQENLLYAYKYTELLYICALLRQREK